MSLATAPTIHISPVGWLVLTGLILLAVAVYAVACWVWPFKACRRCDGSGKLRSPMGKAWRRCKRCHGSGGRLRAGRWIYNRLIRMRRDAD